MHYSGSINSMSFSNTKRREKEMHLIMNPAYHLSPAPKITSTYS